jgi:hypothetical protein
LAGADDFLNAFEHSNHLMVGDGGLFQGDNEAVTFFAVPGIAGGLFGFGFGLGAIEAFVHPDEGEDEASEGTDGAN